MGLFGNLFKKKEVVLDPVDFSEIHTDIHSHFLPGIDDGADTMDQSIQLIKKMKDLGFKKVITTPHVMSDYYRNTKEIIQTKKQDVLDEIERNYINIQFDASAEYYVDDDLERKVLEGEILPIHNKYMLIELPFIGEPMHLSNFIFSTQTHGYSIILAHPERYTYWLTDKGKFHKLKDKDILFQINLNSLSGYYGQEAKILSEWLIDENLIELVGTDCHRLDQLDILENYTSRMPYCHKILEQNLLNKIL